MTFRNETLFVAGKKTYITYYIYQVRRPCRDYLVESATDPAAGDDPRGVEHPEPGDEHEHPARAGGRAQRPPRLPRQVLLRDREAAATGSEDEHLKQLKIKLKNLIENLNRRF